MHSCTARICTFLISIAGLSAQHEWKQVPRPEGRVYATLATDPATGSLVLFGGTGDTLLDDTWVRAGGNWTRTQRDGGPGSRYGHEVVADLARNQLVLFGGWNGGAYVNDTWLRTANGWARIFPASSPGGRYLHAMAWDTARGRAVVYGGYANGNYADTWEWNGAGWVQVLQNSLPGGRYGHAMAYAPDQSASVMFGGYSNGAPVQDTWLWDGQAWTQASPPQRPSPRYHHRMVYDPIRRVVVLYGGWSGTAHLGDTWEWSGTNWSQKATSGPSARNGMAMAFDPQRGRIVLFGGSVGPSPTDELSDLWEWDGSTWTRIEGTMPSPRYAAQMAHDENADNDVLFGGVDNRGNDRVRDDTWLWSGSGWTEAAPTAIPPARGYHTLTYDPVRGETVLYGGWARGPNLGDTWCWKSGNWTKRTPATSPTARHGHAAAFHAGLGELFLFGGHDGSPRNDLWSWDGATWALRVPGGTLPGVRWNAALAYDPIGRRLVLFGGWSGSGSYGDTWSWDSASGNWTQLSPNPPTPPARDHARLVYDPTREALVLFGGSGPGGYLSDTWELRGSAWNKCTQLNEPPARGYHAMAYDSKRQKLWAFGGYPVSGGDLWECSNPNPASFALLQPPGCALGTTGVPRLGPAPGSLPWRGQPFDVELTGLPPTGIVSSLLLVGIPPAVSVSLAPIGFPLCTLYVFPAPIQVPMAVSGPGKASVTLPIPALAGLVGQRFLLQGASFVPFPTPQLGMSQAGQVVVGARHP